MMIWRTLLLVAPLIWVECVAQKNACLSDKNCMKVKEMQGNIKSSSQESSWEFRRDFRNDEHALLLRIKRIHLNFASAGENWCYGTLTIQGMTFCVAEPNTCFVLPESADCEVQNLSDACNETFLTLRNHSRYDLIFKNKPNYYKDYYTFEIEHKFIPCQRLTDSTTARAVSPKSISTGRNVIRISEINLMFKKWWRWCAADVVVAGLKFCNIDVNTCFIFRTSTICEDNLLHANEECDSIIWVGGQKSAALQLQFEEKREYLEESHKICFQNISLGCKESASFGIEPVSTCFPEAEQEIETSYKSGEENTQKSDAKMHGEGDTLISTLTTDSPPQSTPILTKMLGSSGDDTDHHEFSVSGDGNSGQVFSHYRDHVGSKKEDVNGAPSTDAEFTNEMGTTTLSSQEQQSTTKSNDSVTTSTHKQPKTEERTLTVIRTISPSLQTTSSEKATTGTTTMSSQEQQSTTESKDSVTTSSHKQPETEERTLIVQRTISLSLQTTSTGKVATGNGTTTLSIQEQQTTTKSKDSVITSSHNQPKTEDRTQTHQRNIPTGLQITVTGKTATGKGTTTLSSQVQQSTTKSKDSVTTSSHKQPKTEERILTVHRTTPPSLQITTTVEAATITAGEENMFKTAPTTGDESNTPFSTLMTESPSSDRAVSNGKESTHKSDPTTDGDKNTPLSKITTKAHAPDNLVINEEITHASESTTDSEANTPFSTQTAESPRTTTSGISASEENAFKSDSTTGDESNTPFSTLMTGTSSSDPTVSNGKSTTARELQTIFVSKAADLEIKDEGNSGTRPAYGESALLFGIWAIYLSILS